MVCEDLLPVLVVRCLLVLREDEALLLFALGVAGTFRYQLFIERGGLEDVLQPLDSRLTGLQSWSFFSQVASNSLEVTPRPLPSGTVNRYLACLTR